MVVFLLAVASAESQGLRERPGAVRDKRSDYGRMRSFSGNYKEY